jgi:hypothetical protein
MSNNIEILTSLPGADGNYTSALHRASNDEIRQAIDIMLNRDGKDKIRIAICKRELKKRGTAYEY